MWSESVEILNPYEAVMEGIIRKEAEKRMAREVKQAERREKLGKLLFWRNK